MAFYPMIYLLEHGDIDRLELDFSVVARALSDEFGMSVSTYQEMHIAESTGFANFVCDEIRFVLGSRIENGDLDSYVSEFSERWHIDRWVKHPLNELSGGWRKYILQALFIESAPLSNILLIQAFAQYLADDLIAISLRNLRSLRKTPTVLAEWDAAILLRQEGRYGHIEVKATQPPPVPLNGNMAAADKKNADFADQRIIQLQ